MCLWHCKQWHEELRTAHLILIISRHKLALFIILIEMNNISDSQNLCRSLLSRLQSARTGSTFQHTAAAPAPTRYNTIIAN
jgi:hypothetical protein